MIERARSDRPSREGGTVGEAGAPARTDGGPDRPGAASDRGEASAGPDGAASAGPTAVGGDGVPTRLVGRPRRRAPHLAALLGASEIVAGRRGRPAAAREVVWAEPGARVAAGESGAGGVPRRVATEGLLVSVGADPLAPTVSAAILPAAGAAGRRDVESAAFADAVARGLAARPADASSPAADAVLEAIVAARLTRTTPLAPAAGVAIPRRPAIAILADGIRPDPKRLARILDAALAEAPAADVAFLPGGHAALARLAARAAAAGAAVLPPAALPEIVHGGADAVWVDGAADGIFALAAGVRVRAFGAPFFAGLGLTEDTPLSAAERDRLAGRPAADRAALADVALVRLARYADPVTRAPVDPAGAVGRLVDWRTQLVARSRPRVWGKFIPSWKQRFARTFFASGGDPLVYDDKRPVERAAAIGAEVLYWGNRDAVAMKEAARAHPGRPAVVQAEDGFVRSIGLGRDLAVPASWVLDDLGIYYDGTRPSRLERILETEDFDAATLARARRLRETIRGAGISKYNVVGRPFERPAAAGERPVVLALGQVPEDLSLRDGLSPFGGDAVAFLEAVRAARPDAFLVFKEHPELAQRFRPGWLDPKEVAGLVDLFVKEGDTAAMLPAVDEVHVMTSLAGFEALVHGRRVTCWGLPFFAGWGLTEDRVACPRRTRRRTLDELVAAALIRYPIYVEPLSGVPCTPEEAVDSLARARREAAVRGGFRLSTPFSPVYRWHSIATAHLRQPFVVAPRRRARKAAARAGANARKG